MRRAFATAALLLAAAGAGAAPLTYKFTGSVDHDDANRGWASFSGSFSFDSAAADTIADAQTGAYAHAGASWTLTLTFDAGAPIVLDEALHVLVSNNLGGTDTLGVLASDGQRSVSLELLDLDAGLFGSDALPTQPLTLADFEWTSLRLEDGGVLSGRLATLACSAGCALVPPPPVPEPGSAALTMLGLGVLLAARRHRNHEQAR